MSKHSRVFSPEALAALRRHMLLVPALQALVLEDAIANVEIEPEEVERLHRQWRGELSPEQAAAQMAERLGWDADDIHWQVTREARRAKLARERYATKAEARFLQRKADLDQVAYSLVRTQDQGLANELYLRLIGGEATFEGVAAQFSDGPEKSSGGKIGPRPASEAHPELAERLRTARDGEIMEPFPVLDFWLIVRRDQYLPAVFDQAMADQMAGELLQEWVESEAKAELVQLSASLPSPNAHHV